MIKKTFCIILSTFLMVTLCFSLMVSSSAADSTTVSYYTPPTDNTIQYKFTTIKKDPKWTSVKTLEGQNSGGTYCSVGDQLGYYTSSGTNVTISFSVGYGIGTVGISVPLGTAKGKTSGYLHTKKVTKAGYYVVQGQKYIQPTIVLTQSRRKNSNTGKWSDWSKAKVKTKSSTVIKDKYTLKYLGA